MEQYFYCCSTINLRICTYTNISCSSLTYLQRISILNCEPHLYATWQFNHYAQQHCSLLFYKTSVDFFRKSWQIQLVDLVKRQHFLTIVFILRSQPAESFLAFIGTCQSSSENEAPLWKIYQTRKQSSEYIFFKCKKIFSPHQNRFTFFFHARNA